jgi:hypothetical protein
MLVPVDAA